MLNNLFSVQPEQRAITAATLFAAGDLLPATTKAGVNVTQQTSMQIGSVYAAVRLIADTISMLPVDTYYRTPGGERELYRPRPIWVENPDVDGVPRSDFYQSVMVSLLINGNAFLRILRDNRGDVLAFSVLDPTLVEVKRNQSGQVAFYVDNGTREIPASEMVHLTELRRPGQLRGVSRVDELRETLGLTQALQEFSARFFGSGSTTSGVIEIPNEITADQAKALQDGWEKGHKGLRKAFRPGILSGGAKFMKTSVDPDEAQMLQSREFAVEEICRIFRIPPHLLSVTKPGAMSYASVEENNKAFVQFTLLPYIASLEESLSRLLPGEAFLRFNVDGLLRASLQDRYAAYSQGIQAGFLSINDIHRVEDMPPVEGGDVIRVPLANVNLDAANIVEQEKRISNATRLINVGFDPAAVLSSLGLPAIMHTGVPSVQLQGVATIDPEDPAEVYPADDADNGDRGYAQDIADAISGAIRSIPGPVVNVSLPEPEKRTRLIERDGDGNISKIVEE